MSKTVVIAAGGTGGHLFPAQALAEELRALSDIAIHFMGKGLSVSKHFNADRYSYTDIHSGPMSIQGGISILRGIVESMRKLKMLTPSLVVGFGSYHSFPVLVAAYLLKIPIVLHEANRTAGRVNRLFSSKAEWTGIFFPDTKLKGVLYATNIPLRPHFSVERWPSKNAGYERYKLEPYKKTILVFGGSLGAKKLNYLAQEAIGALDREAIQVIHFTGCVEASRDIAKEYENRGICSHVAHFEEEMPFAWSIADVVVCRAGASTIAEQLLFGVPALFVPYPFSQDAHQDKNAAFVRDVVGGARVCIEKESNAQDLTGHLLEMLTDCMHKKMKLNIAQYQQEQKIETFSTMIHQFLQESVS